MRVCDLSVEQAKDVLTRVGARYATQATPICAIGVQDEGDVLHGVAIMGRVSKGVAEISHIYSDGERQVFTTLYGNSVRILKALGYKMMALDTL